MNNGKYNTVKDEIIANIRAGDSNKVAYEKAGISETTFYDWMAEKAEFSVAVKQAQAEHRREKAKLVEESLFKRAIGYKTEEVKTEFMAGADGKPVIVKQTKTNKEVPPDTGAAIFILTNSDPEKWQNRQNTQFGVDEKITGIRVEVVKGDNVPPIASNEEDVV